MQPRSPRSSRRATCRSRRACRRDSDDVPLVRRYLYDIALWRSQYLLYHASGALLTRFVGDAILANRLLLTGVVVALPLSLRAALRALDRDPALAVLGCMPFLSRPLFIGFLPYIASFPLYFFGIAMVVRRAARPGWRADARLALLAVALCYTHLSALVVFVATAVALDGLLALRNERRGLGAWARAFAWLVPVAAITLLWSVTGKITVRGESLRDVGEIGKMDLLRSIYAVPLWTFDILRSHVDELCGVAWWACLALLSLFASREVAASKKPRLLLARIDPAYVPLLAVLVIYFVTPFRAGAGGMLNVRLAPLIALTAVLTVGRSEGGPDRRAAPRRAWVLGAATLATVVHAGNATREIRALAREHMTGFDAVLAAIRPGSRLVTLAFDMRKERTHYDPYPFAGSYQRAAGGGVASYSFSELPHWPVQFRPAQHPPAKPSPLWIYAPCEYRHGVDGPFYDYLLVSGGVDPFAGHPAGPAFREIVRVPDFVLYAKIPGERWTGTLEGPCVDHPPPTPSEREDPEQGISGAIAGNCGLFRLGWLARGLLGCRLMHTLLRNLRLAPVMLLAPLALTASLHVGCANAADDATDEGNAAVSGGSGSTHKAPTGATPIAGSTLKLPIPGSKKNKISEADKVTIVNAWLKAKKDYYDAPGTLYGAAPPPDYSEVATVPCVPYYGDLACHFYQHMPSYKFVTPNYRGCFTYQANGAMEVPSNVWDPKDAPNGTREGTYAESFDHCLYQNYDAAKNLLPDFDIKEILANKAKGAAGEVGVLKYMSADLRAAFKFIMYSWYEPATYDQADQMDILARVYKVIGTPTPTARTGLAPHEHRDIIVDALNAYIAANKNL